MYARSLKSLKTSSDGISSRRNFHLPKPSPPNPAAISPGPSSGVTSHTLGFRPQKSKPRVENWQLGILCFDIRLPVSRDYQDTPAWHGLCPRLEPHEGLEISRGRRGYTFCLDRPLGAQNPASAWEYDSASGDTQKTPKRTAKT